MLTKTLYFLIKIGKKEHIELLRDNGLLYLNTIQYFKDIEEQHRGDKNECLSGIEQFDWMKIIIGEKEFHLQKASPIKGLNNTQIRFNDPDLKGNIYSMIAVSSDTDANNLAGNCQNKSLGDTFLVITNVVAFFNRIGKQLNDMGYKYKFEFVTYYDPSTHHGELSVFHKEISYKHQSEFRIFVENASNEPLSLNIGSIADISVLLPIDQFGEICMLPSSKNHKVDFSS